MGTWLKITILFFFTVSFIESSVFTQDRGDDEEGEKSQPTKPERITGAQSAARTAKDFAGREWSLSDWPEGTRPYKKDLAEREKAYREKWGEDWVGTVGSMGTGRTMIFSPGVWKFEEFMVIPDGKRASPHYKLPGGHNHPRGGTGYAMIFAPGGGEVTDIYVGVRLGMYHVDARSKEIAFIGDKELVAAVQNVAPADCNDKWKNLTVEETGWVPVYLKPLPEYRDGLDNMARLIADGEIEGTVDPVRGRVYFAEPTGRRGNNEQGPSVLRYVEKLLPYAENGKEVLLPEIMDHKEMYKLVKGPGGGALEPVMKNGKRAKPRFAVRTTAVKNYLGPALQGGGGWGRKIVLSIDGKLAYTESGGKIFPVEIDTGKAMAPVPAGPLPAGWSNNYHGGGCGRWDGFFYNSSGQGSGPSAGVLIRMNLADGKVAMLYNSNDPAYGAARQKAGMKFWDGPADAVSLYFSSSDYQFQCPRTGAIFNGGWDGSGTRRYHDGFVTTFGGSTFGSSRPEWKDATMPQGAFGHMRQSLAMAPNGDVYYSCKHSPGARYSKEFPKWARETPESFRLMRDGLRIMHLWRTDWPKEQPVNGYADQFLSPEKRDELILEYVKDYIVNYVELSKLY